MNSDPPSFPPRWLASPQTQAPESRTLAEGRSPWDPRPKARSGLGPAGAEGGGVAPQGERWPCCPLKGSGGGRRLGEQWEGGAHGTRVPSPAGVTPGAPGSSAAGPWGSHRSPRPRTSWGPFSRPSPPAGPNRHPQRAVMAECPTGLARVSGEGQGGVGGTAGPEPPRHGPALWPTPLLQRIRSPSGRLLPQAFARSSPFPGGRLRRRLDVPRSPSGLRSPLARPFPCVPWPRPQRAVTHLFTMLAVSHPASGTSS